MDLLLIGVIGAVAVVTVTALAPRVGVSAPLLLVALGVGISLLPVVPAVEIEPEWILAGVLPPLLYATSVSVPTMDFRRDLTAISGLSVLLVVATSVVLGLIFSWLIPDVTLATGIALGAVLSPTDAVATSLVRKSGVSPRVVTGLVAGSGSVRLRPQDRIAEAANWRTLELLLEGAVFLIMGLELYGLVAEVQADHGHLWTAVGLGVLSAAVVLVVRSGYVAYLLSRLSRRARRGVTVRGYLSALNDRADSLATLTREDLAARRIPGAPPAGAAPRATTAPVDAAQVRGVLGRRRRPRLGRDDAPEVRGVRLR